MRNVDGVILLALWLACLPQLVFLFGIKPFQGLRQPAAVKMYYGVACSLHMAKEDPGSSVSGQKLMRQFWSTGGQRGGRQETLACRKPSVMLGGKVATLSSSDVLKSSALAQLFGWAQSALSPVQKEKDGYAYSDMYNHMYVCIYIYIYTHTHRCMYVYL